MLQYDDRHRVTTTDVWFVQGFIEMFTDGWPVPHANKVRELKSVYVVEPDGTKTYLYQAEGV